MLWVLLFTAGLIVLLAGVSSLILKGPRIANSFVAGLGILVLGAGVGGVIVKPHLPALTFADSGDPAPIEKANAPAAEVTVPVAPPVDPAPVASQPAPSQQPVAATVPPPAPANPTAADAKSAADKDESQLAPVRLPGPVPVTTTTVAGSPPDPLADPATPPTPVPSPAASSSAPAAGAAAAPAAAAADAAPAPAAGPSDADRLAALADRQPKDQAAFIKAVTNARAAFDNANDDQRVALQPQRAAAICAAVKKPEVQSWVGQLGDIDRDAGGRSIVSVTLADGTTLKTWNNAMSDLDDKTLILAGTPLAAALGKLQRGDSVKFSGSFFADDPDCFRSTRLSLDQSMREPSFLFRFTALDKL